MAAFTGSKELMKDGFRKFGKWMQEAEEIWGNKRAAKANNQNVYERLDYQKELTSQALAQRHLVLYNAAGTNVTRRNGVVGMRPTGLASS